MGGGSGEAKPFKSWEPAGTYYVRSGWRRTIFACYLLKLPNYMA